MILVSSSSAFSASSSSAAADRFCWEARPPPPRVVVVVVDRGSLQRRRRGGARCPGPPRDDDDDVVAEDVVVAEESEEDAPWRPDLLDAADAVVLLRAALGATADVADAAVSVMTCARAPLAAARASRSIDIRDRRRAAGVLPRAAVSCQLRAASYF